MEFEKSYVQLSNTLYLYKSILNLISIIFFIMSEPSTIDYDQIFNDRASFDDSFEPLSQFTVSFSCLSSHSDRFFDY